MRTSPLLIFQGECQAALDLYARAFDTAPDAVMRFGDLPADPDHPIPPGQLGLVLITTLPLGGDMLRLSDTLGALNAPQSDRLAVNVECSPEQVRRAFGVLAEKGSVSQPLQETFFSPCYGIAHDEFGVM